MSLRKQQDFREYLISEFKSRQVKNSKYSLRAYSKHLEIDSSHLSKILKGQRPLNEQLVATMGTKLGLSRPQIEKFKAGTPKPYGKNRSLDTMELDDCYQLKLDQLALISEWHHYAIMEIMKHPRFEPRPAWLAKELQLNEDVITKAIERLKRIGLLEVQGDGSWKDISDGFSTHVLGNDLTSRAHRAYQSQVLRLANTALFRVPIERRDHSTIVVASSAKKLREAKNKIKTFRRELAEFLEDCDEKSEVYHLSISLFPLPSNPDDSTLDEEKLHAF